MAVLCSLMKVHFEIHGPGGQDRAPPYLDLPQLAGALHPAGHVHRVAPDVILGFPGADDSSDHWAVVDTCSERSSSSSRFQLLHQLHSRQDRQQIFLYYTLFIKNVER